MRWCYLPCMHQTLYSSKKVFLIQTGTILTPLATFGQRVIKNLASRPPQFPIGHQGKNSEQIASSCSQTRLSLHQKSLLKAETVLDELQGPEGWQTELCSLSGWSQRLAAPRASPAKEDSKSLLASVLYDWKGLAEFDHRCMSCLLLLPIIVKDG